MTTDQPTKLTPENGHISTTDNARLAYRSFMVEPARAVVIHLHGSSYNSRRYVMLGKVLASAGVKPYLMDLRGNGDSTGPRGHTDYVGQLEDDLAETVMSVRQHHPGVPVFLSAHSAGCVVLLRYQAKYGSADVAGYLFLSPALPGCMETHRYDIPAVRFLFPFMYWRQVPHFNPVPKAFEKYLYKSYLWRYFLGKLFPFLRRLTVSHFPAPAQQAAMENRVQDYSYNMSASLSVRHYQDAFSQIDRPVWLAIGEKDEVTDPSAVSVIHQWHLARATSKVLHVIPAANHLTVVGKAGALMKDWISAQLPERSSQLEIPQEAACS
ncbi:alpha/beta hydrolase [Marinobacteraceae bacterium S3BR75-40.1]